MKTRPRDTKSLVMRYAAFTADPSGGNPAGVVLGADGLDTTDMAAIASDVGFSETAFATARADGSLDVRYFSPEIEVPFCGHATIALAVAHAHNHGVGDLCLHTRAGDVRVGTGLDQAGTITATLVSVPPKSAPITATDQEEMLAALRWWPEDLDQSLPARAAYAGAWHPIIAAASRDRLTRLDYDMDALGAIMVRRDWATVNLIWRESAAVFHARNPFPPGGVYEDPATGAAAAALGGYLRELQLVTPPTVVTVHQGHDMGRPGTITVTIPPGPDAGIAVAGTAVPL